MAFKAAHFMRTGARVSPSWPEERPPRPDTLKQTDQLWATTRLPEKAWNPAGSGRSLVRPVGSAQSRHSSGLQKTVALREVRS
jgi:hypothetical protein